MATKKVGDLIKEARTNAGLSQEALAKQVDGVSASDIGKAERGEKELTQAALKAIAKATGVTQKSLLEAPSGVKKAASSAKKTASSTAKKTSSSTAKKTSSTAKTSSSSAKKTSSTAKKTAATTSVELTSAEKTLLNAYRKADAETQKAALKLLKGEKDADLLSTLLSGAMDMLGNFGKK